MFPPVLQLHPPSIILLLLNQLLQNQENSLDAKLCQCVGFIALVEFG